ncbi:hypothetical protein NQ317_000757 [Molorchus minor]|uniref:Major facilitator superfamily (MFS) profile domain-containing protein n=1 Tax=Molorchus minor TaxID=1323400 RepID=A0ABQ9J5K0_9CUCU|nr:hypothetical protein NQ317_000757 [Molorchus minor]
MSWVSSLMPLAALFGGLCGGSLIEHLGRKSTILLMNILLLLAWIVNYNSKEHWHLYFSRITNGIGVGIVSLSLPVYLAETLQPEVRGSLGLMPSVFGNLGILICFTAGIFYQWRGLALIGLILSLPFFLLIWWIPETPIYLLSKGSAEKSKKALRWLRGPDPNNDKEFFTMRGKP